MKGQEFNVSEFCKYNGLKIVNNDLITKWIIVGEIHGPLLGDVDFFLKLLTIDQLRWKRSPQPRSWERINTYKNKLKIERWNSEYP